MHTDRPTKTQLTSMTGGSRSSAMEERGGQILINLPQGCARVHWLRILE